MVQTSLVLRKRLVSSDRLPGSTSLPARRSVTAGPAAPDSSTGCQGRCAPVQERVVRGKPELLPDAHAALGIAQGRGGHLPEAAAPAGQGPPRRSPAAGVEEAAAHLALVLARRELCTRE